MSTVRLPAGVRDYLPEAAARRRVIVEALVGDFERWGYQRIITPAFEFEDVLARGAGAGAGASAVRFVDPGSGDVAALRPDFTPQVARLVATRMSDIGGPIRLCYEGSVTRAEGQGGARREVIQAGVELIDAPVPGGDVEVLSLAAEALSSVGLSDATLDVAEVSPVREALGGLDPELAAEARGAIAKKDRAAVQRIARGAGLPARRRRLLEALPSLYGGPDVAAVRACLREARGLCETPRARAGLDELEQTLTALAAVAPALRVVIDLGEVRGFDYYTGVRFAGYVDGAPGAVLVGGRYDDLIARYGRAARATGFAVDVEAVAGALKRRVRPLADGGGPNGRAPSITLVAGDGPAARAVARALRSVGRPVALELANRRGERELREYAERLGLEPILLATRAGVRVVPQRGRDVAAHAWLPEYLAARLAADKPARDVKSARRRRSS